MKNAAFDIGDWVQIIGTNSPFDGRTGIVIANKQDVSKVRLAPVPDGIALETLDVDSWEHLTDADAPEGYCLGCGLKHGEKPIPVDDFEDEEDDERD